MWYPYYCAAAWKETAEHDAAVRWRKGIDRDCTAVCDSGAQTVAVLSVR